MRTVCWRRDRRGRGFLCCGSARGFSFLSIRFAGCSWPEFLSAVRGNRKKFPGGRGAAILLVPLRLDAFFLRQTGPSRANLFRWLRDNFEQNLLLVAWPPLGI